MKFPTPKIMKEHSYTLTGNPNKELKSSEEKEDKPMTQMERIRTIAREQGEEAGVQALQETVGKLSNELLAVAGPLAQEDLILLYTAVKLLERLAADELGDKLPAAEALWQAIRNSGEAGYTKIQLP